MIIDIFIYSVTLSHLPSNLYFAPLSRVSFPLHPLLFLAPLTFERSIQTLTRCKIMCDFVPPHYPNGLIEFNTWLEIELSGRTIRYGIEVLRLPKKLYVLAL